MKKLVGFSVVMLSLTIAAAGFTPVLAQEEATAEAAEAAEEVSHEEPAADEHAAEDDAAGDDAPGEPATPETHATQSHGADQGTQAGPGQPHNGPIAMLLTGMVVLFAAGAIAIRRL